MYRKDAIGSGSVKVVNEQIYDVNGKNPYEQKMLFAVAPKEKYYHGKTIRFKFSSNLFVNNTDRVVKNLQVNFNNEGGYRTASWNNDITHTFSSTGIKDIYFRITYTDNTTYTCRTKISIGEEPARHIKISRPDIGYTRFFPTFRREDTDKICGRQHLAENKKTVDYSRRI
ncbi:hypothetical protein [Tannerella forsythia]|uniref:hypothetical protein n=1 Tax=Tannerella forsythia TaxID=28112 RepID=UPI0028E1A29F|nr:hypothetical protein [Tannerella forsythia]